MASFTWGMRNKRGSDAGSGRFRRGATWSACTALVLALFSTPVIAQELPPGNECSATAAASLPGTFVAGWNSNNPTMTGDADSYSNPSSWSTVNGVDTTVLASALAQVPAVPTLTQLENPPGTAQAPAATGLTRYWEGTERSRYLLGGVTDADLNTAVGNQRYIQYGFTTASTMAAGTFLKKVYLLSYSDAKFKYTVRASDDPTFATFWTLAQDVQITTGPGNANTYQRFPQDNARLPVLAPNKTYYLRLYIYDATVSAIVATNSATPRNLPPAGTMVAVADDFMFGTAVCPPPKVTVTKTSTGKVGTFNFSGTNGYPKHAITTTVIGTGVAGPTENLTAAYTATTVSESATAGFNLTSITCSNLGTGVATPNIPGTGSTGGSVVLNAAATQWGNNIACTFTNTSTDADLQIVKTNGAGVTSVKSGSKTTYTVTATNHGPVAAHGATVRDTPTSGLSNCAVLSCTPSTSPAAACPATLSDVLAAGGAVIPTLPSGGNVAFQVQCDVQ